MKVMEGGSCFTTEHFLKIKKKTNFCPAKHRAKVKRKRRPGKNTCSTYEKELVDQTTTTTTKQRCNGKGGKGCSQVTFGRGNARLPRWLWECVAQISLPENLLWGGRLPDSLELQQPWLHRRCFLLALASRGPSTVGSLDQDASGTSR